MTKRKTPMSQANDEQRRHDAMVRFVGHVTLADLYVGQIGDAAGLLASREPDVSYIDRDRIRFNDAEVALPGLLTQLNLAVEGMNAELGKWIGAGEG